MDKPCTVYEWDIEPVDEYGDIIDHDQRTSLSRVRVDDLREAIDKGWLVLVRDCYKIIEGELDLADRSWAYVTEGLLPKETTAGYPVPKRYQDELIKWRKRNEV